MEFVTLMKLKNQCEVNRWLKSVVLQNVFKTGNQFSNILAVVTENCKKRQENGKFMIPGAGRVFTYICVSVHSVHINTVMDPKK